MIGRVLGHYRIVEKIGAGGMGEVYRAHDEQLDRDVALKVLPAGTLADEAARRQFRKEALVLAKLNHANIETVHEFGSQEGVDFLVMELIGGQSLREKLKKGPMPEREIVWLGRQFAEGLVAAHEQGVVHRDLKPGNLMITPDGRLKILDFGLAKLLRPELDGDVTQSISEAHGVVGTLPYMSPEQLQGQVVDVRSDVYAAGAVLYEMAVGRRAFPDEHGPRLIDAILHQTPMPPSRHNRRVSSTLNIVILKALEKEPSRRYQLARELLVALEGVAAGVAPPAARRRNPLVATASAALGLILLVSLLLGLNVGGLRERLLHRGVAGMKTAGLPVTPTKMRRSVAVLGFQNLSRRPNQAWLSTALAEMLTTELAAGEQLRTIPGENIARAKKDLSLPDADTFALDTLTQVRKNLGTDYIVVGSYIALGKQSGGRVRLDLRLQDASTGETIASVAETGTDTDIFELATAAGAELRRKVGLSEISPAEIVEVRASLSSNSEATRLYSEGLVKLRLFDALAARDLFQKAVSADPNFALAHAALSAAWSVLGYDAKAMEESSKALDHSAELSREDRISMEGRYRETRNEWERAVEIYRTLFGFFPDNLEYGLRLASAQISAAKGRDALSTVEAMRKLPLPASEDPRIDLMEGAAAQSVSDFRLEQGAAHSAAMKAGAKGARLQLARAQLMEGWACLHLGDPKKATDLYTESRETYAVAGDRGGEAGVLNNLGIVFTTQGNNIKAMDAYKEAFAIRRKIGNKKEMSSILSNIAILLDDQGDLLGAKTKYEEALAIKREIDDKRGVAALFNNVGILLKQQGDLNDSRKRFEQALTVYREIGLKSGVQMALDNAGTVLIFEGDLKQGLQMIQEALTIARELGAKDAIAADLTDLGEALYLQGDLKGAENSLNEALMIVQGSGNRSYAAQIHAQLAEAFLAKANLVQARKEYEQAFNIENELGEKGNAAEDRVGLASVAIEESHPADAEAPLRQAIEQFQSARQSDNEIRAEVVLAEALLSAGNRVSAKKEIEHATGLAIKSQNQLIHLKLAINVARIHAAFGRTGDAIRDLATSLEEATNFACLPFQLEARLAREEIQMKSGDVAASQTRLVTLEKDASTKGFLLIARKAAAARK